MKIAEYMLAYIWWWYTYSIFVRSQSYRRSHQIINKSKWKRLLLRIEHRPPSPLTSSSSSSSSSVIYLKPCIYHTLQIYKYICTFVTKFYLYINVSSSSSHMYLYVKRIDIFKMKTKCLYTYNYIYLLFFANK